LHRLFEHLECPGDGLVHVVVLVVAKAAQEAHVGVLLGCDLKISGVQLPVGVGGHGVVPLVLPGDEVLRVLLGDNGPVGFVIEVVLVLVDAGEVVVVGVVDGGAGLVVLPVVGLHFEMDAPVWEGSKGVIHELVDGAGVEDEVVAGGVEALEACIQFHFDVGPVQHLPDHLGVALEGYALIGVLEVPVVPGEVHGDAGGDGAVQGRGAGAPLLLGVVDEDILVDVFGEEYQIRVILGHEVLDGDLGAVLVALEELVLDPVGQFLGKCFADGVEVEGDGDLVAFYDRDHSVHVRVESREPVEEIPHSLVGGVKDVGAVPVDHYPVPVAVVEAVAGDVVGAVDDGHFVGSF